MPPREVVDSIRAVIKKATVAALALALLTGCASAGNVAGFAEWAYQPKPSTCLAAEPRPTWQSTIPFVICFDEQAKPINMVAGQGQPTSSVVLGFVGATTGMAQAAATGYAGYEIGKGLVDLGKNGLRVVGDVNASGNITTTGSVTGTIAPLTVQPIPTLTVAPVPPLTGTINLVPGLMP